MEDFYYAGGVPAVVRALGEHDLLHRDALTVNGKTIWENCRGGAELERGGDPALGPPAAGAWRHRRVCAATWRRTARCSNRRRRRRI